MKPILFRASLAIFFAELFNALNVNAQKYLLSEWCSPFSMLIIRVAFGCFLFWGLALLGKSEKVARKDVIRMISIGALSLTAYMTFYLLGVEKSSPIDSSLIMSTMPIFVLGLAIFFFGEKLSMLKGIGMFSGILGTVIVILVQKKTAIETNSVIGNLFCLFSALSYGFYLIINKSFSKKYAPVTMLKWLFSGALLISIPLILLFGWQASIFEPGTEIKPLLVLAFVLLFPTGLTYLLIPFALKHLQATSVAMYDYEVPIVASLLGVFLGQAVFDWYQLLAALLIFIGVYLVSKENRRMRQVTREYS